jgi:diguanylate cyclase (GGDEF)-like protein
VNFAVLFLDLDGFKVVNDSLGHHIGDRLLVEVGNRLRASLRAVDTAARVGGDEFVLLLLDIEPRDVPGLVDKVQASLGEPFDLDGHQVVATASIGIATSRTDYGSADDVLRDADIAMYRAKAGERGSYEIFDAAMHARAVKRLQTEVELRRAFDLGEFELHYQPIVDLETCRAQAFEALIRWRHPERGLVSPDDFLPVAEETGLIVRLGHWIIDETCRQIAQWRESYDGELCVSVNVSNREFWHGGVLEHVTAALARHGVPTSALKLEITEGVIMHNAHRAEAIVDAMHQRGHAVHIDDFGTGYSSLGALHSFPIDALKIDRSFVVAMSNGTRSAELAHTIVMMGVSLGLDVIAEGIEEPEQRDMLVRFGCTFGQGFLYSEPLAAHDVAKLFPGALRAAAGRTGT